MFSRKTSMLSDSGVPGEDTPSTGESAETPHHPSENENEQDKIWSKLIKDASTKCKKKLLEYYNKTNDSYLISIILDPRLKLQYYKDQEWGEQLIGEIQQKLVYCLIFNDFLLNNN